MPKIKTNEFSTQTNKSYRIISEFINILDKTCIISMHNIFLHNGFCLIATAYLNKIYVFLKNNQKILFLQLFEEQNNLFKSIDISMSGSKIIALSSNNLIVYGLNSKFINLSEFFSKSYKFFKILDLFYIKETNDNITFATLNRDEKSLIISYKSGNLRVFDLEKKKNFHLNIKIVMEQIDTHFNFHYFGKIYGKTSSNFFIEYDIFRKKILFTKQIKFFLIEYNYIMLQIQNLIDLRCFCHNISIINVNLPFSCHKIIFITQNILFIENNNKFYLLKLGTKLLKNCLLEFHLNERIISKSENIQKIFVCNNNCTNFILTLITEINTIIFLKPISEKHKILLSYNPKIYNFTEIYAIKCIGPKNSIVLAANNCYINIYEGKNFFLKNFYHFKSYIFLNLDIKGNILIASNNLGMIIFWRIDTCEVLNWIDISNNTKNIFSLFEKIENEGFLVSGGRDCIIKLWKIIFHYNFKLEIRLMSKSKIENNNICLISTYRNGNIFATASHEKKVLLWKITQKDPFLELEKFKRSIWSLNFSYTEEILGIGTSDGFVYFFNILNGFCLKKISTHDSPVTNCLFNLDGNRLFTSDSKGKIKIWKLNTETCTNVIAKQKACIWALCINQDNTLIISGCNNGTIIIIKDIASDLFLNKTNSVMNFLKIQKAFNREYNFKKNYFTLKTIFIQRDPILLYDFLKFLFTDASSYFDYIVGSFVRNISIDWLKFLCRSIINWNLEKKKLYFSQHIVKILILNIKPFFWKDVDGDILNSLLFTVKNVKRLAYTYKQIIRNT